MKNNKTTPLQELIQFMEQNQYFIGNDLYAKQKELLEKEKEMVVEAVSTTIQSLAFCTPLDANNAAKEYFNENYGR